MHHIRHVSLLYKHIRFAACMNGIHWFPLVQFKAAIYAFSYIIGTIIIVFPYFLNIRHIFSADASPRGTMLRTQAAL